MVKLAEAGTKALTVDDKLDSIGKLKDLGLELGKLNPKNLTFTTVPVVDNPAEKVKSTVVLNKEKAPAVFDAIRNDVSLHRGEEEAEGGEGRPGRPAQGPQGARLRGAGAHPQRRGGDRQRTGGAGAGCRTRRA